MILNNKETINRNLGFETGGKMSVQNKNLSKVFKLLTTSTYKSREESVLREICSNAVDAQVSVGKVNDPIYLTYKDNTISIRDNGIGMSDYFVNSEYMSLGESTKENDESQIGAFGIGRASIFSYTKFYTLISRYNGVKSTYLIAETEDGLPDVTPLSSTDTDECNGVEVKFELVNENDFSIFKKAAEDQLKYFRNIVIEGFNIPNEYKLFQGTNFIYRPDRTNISGNLELVWHNVRYPIDFVYLGIPSIKVNCAIYFPQNTPFQPEAARENLRNTENNKKLILDKIEEFRTEITDLWKKEQEVESFFDFCNKSKKTVTFEGNELDVSDIITESYIYKPLIDTKINPHIFKQGVYRIYDSLFIHRQNSRYYSNSISYIGINKKIFHSPKLVSNDKLSRNEWQAFIRPSESSVEYLVDKFYTDVKYGYDKAVQDFVISNPNNIDYKKEIEHIRSCIWKEITEKTIDINTLTVKKDRSITKIEKSEVRVKTPLEKYAVYDVDYFKDYRYVVFTTSQEEFDELCDLNIEGYTNNGSKRRKSINKFFIPLLGAKKYEGKILHAISYEEFLKSDLLKKYYFKNVKRSLIYNTRVDEYVIRSYNDIHRMYSKYYYLKDYFDKYKSRNNFNLHLRMKSKLSKMYTTDIVEKEVSDNLNIYNKLLKISNTDVLKYKLLYTSQKKRVQSLIKQIK